MDANTRTMTIGNHEVDVMSNRKWTAREWKVIVLDTRNAWEYEQRKPCKARRTLKSVAQSMVDLYEGRNDFATVAGISVITL